MDKIEDIIKREHGNSCMLALDGDARSIINEHQKLLDDGEYNDHPYVYLGISKPDQVAAQEAYNRLKHTVLTRWMQSVTREQMVATLNTLAMTPFASLEYLPGEPISSVFVLAQAWNEANPASPEIHVNPDYLLNI